MWYYIKRAFSDIFAHRFLSIVTIITTAFAVSIVSAFIFLFVNTDRLMIFLKQNVKITVYMESDITDVGLLYVKAKISDFDEVESVKFISKDEAFKNLRTKMSNYDSLFETLAANPLPDSLHARMKGDISISKIKNIASRIEKLSGVSDVSYAKKWVDKFAGIFSLFRMAGISGGIFLFAVTAFFTANTIRLVLYSRRDEIQIMRLVGARDNFIKAPFYLQSVFSTGLGGIMGYLVFYFSVRFFPFDTTATFLPQGFNLIYPDIRMISAIVLTAILVGWFGCFISLRHFLKA